MNRTQFGLNSRVQGGALGSKLRNLNMDHSGKNHTRESGRCLQEMPSHWGFLVRGIKGLLSWVTHSNIEDGYDEYE